MRMAYSSHVLAYRVTGSLPGRAGPQEVRWCVIRGGVGTDEPRIPTVRLTPFAGGVVAASMLAHSFAPFLRGTVVMKRETPAAIRRRLKQLGCTPEQIERHVVLRGRLPRARRSCRHAQDALWVALCDPSPASCTDPIAQASDSSFGAGAGLQACPVSPINCRTAIFRGALQSKFPVRGNSFIADTVRI